MEIWDQSNPVIHLIARALISFITPNSYLCSLCFADLFRFKFQQEGNSLFSHMSIVLSTRNNSAFKNNRMGEYLEMLFLFVPDILVRCRSSSVGCLCWMMSGVTSESHPAVVMWRMLEACSNFS